MQEWRVAKLGDIDEPGAVEFRTGQGDWPFRGILVRWRGEIYAYTNSCAHLGYPLNFAEDQFFTPDKQLLMCTSHGALFEPATGKCVGGPCMGASLRSLESRVDDDNIYVMAPASMRER